VQQPLVAGPSLRLVVLEVDVSAWLSQPVEEDLFRSYSYMVVHDLSIGSRTNVGLFVPQSTKFDIGD